MSQASGPLAQGTADGLRAMIEWPATLSTQMAIAQRQMLDSSFAWHRACAELCEDAWERWLSIFAGAARLDD